MKKNSHVVADNTSTYHADPPNAMFTEASFASLLNGLDLPLEIKAEEHSYPPIVSFYGLKGGAGRSLCLANTAVLLARRGLRVAVIDFDFEAPGLHSIFDVKNPSKGSLGLLEDGNYKNRPCDIWPSIATLSIENKGKVMVMPAGEISAEYLQRLEELRPLLWNEYQQQPITRLFSAFSKDEFDIILVDCRTGFHGITASLLFHYSDLVVSVFPLSEQIWTGVDVIAQAFKNARKARETAPDWLIVPSMVPASREGAALLQEYSERLKKIFTINQPNEDGEWNDDGSVWVLPNGISYHQGIALNGQIPKSFIPGGSWTMFEPLVDQMIASLNLGLQTTTHSQIPYKEILNELKIPAAHGFAEELKLEDIQNLLVPSDDLKMSLDAMVGIIVGAKGSGKTLVWRCCVEEIAEGLVKKDKTIQYAVGHPPKPELDPERRSLSRDQMVRIERDAKLQENDSYEKFWILYAIYRLCAKYEGMAKAISSCLSKESRSIFNKEIVKNPGWTSLLQNAQVLDAAENLLLLADAFLRSLSGMRIVLCYDGLDIDFQGTELHWVERRNRFVKSLLLMVSTYRGRLSRILFKVFLREDIYLSIDGLQNKSHMEAYKKELRFQPKDLWRLAMNLCCRHSDTFARTIQQLFPVAHSPWDFEEKTLKDMLNILWGQIMGKGNKTITTNYIVRRISDSQGRFFPRTFVQLMLVAVEHAKKSAPSNDRVLSHQSLTQGVEKASAQRTEDLLGEYVELKEYLNAMKDLKANFKRQDFVAHLRKTLKSKEKPKWNESYILDQLESIGVLSKSTGPEESWSVALMYRPGLHVKGAGII